MSWELSDERDPAWSPPASYEPTDPGGSTLRASSPTNADASHDFDASIIDDVLDDLALNEDVFDELREDDFEPAGFESTPRASADFDRASSDDPAPDAAPSPSFSLDDRSYGESLPVQPEPYRPPVTPDLPKPAPVRLPQRGSDASIPGGLPEGERRRAPQIPAVDPEHRDVEPPQPARSGATSSTLFERKDSVIEATESRPDSPLLKRAFRLARYD